MNREFGLNQNFCLDLGGFDELWYFSIQFCLSSCVARFTSKAKLETPSSPFSLDGGISSFAKLLALNAVEHADCLLAESVDGSLIRKFWKCCACLVNKCKLIFFEPQPFNHLLIGEQAPTNR